MNTVYHSQYGNLYLCHSRYKYLKREWKNGNWHYTYPNTNAINDSRDLAKRYSKEGTHDVQAMNDFKKLGNKYKEDVNVYRNYLDNDRKTAFGYRDDANKMEAFSASHYRDVVKKWESTPISKIQTAYHRAADSVKKTLSKWKNALVSAFTPKETVRMITTNPRDGYRNVTIKKK